MDLLLGEYRDEVDVELFGKRGVSKGISHYPLWCKKKVLKVVAVVSNDAHHHLLLPLLSLSNFFAVSHNLRRRCVCVCCASVECWRTTAARDRSCELWATTSPGRRLFSFLRRSSFLCSLLFSVPCSLLDFGSGRAITLREEKERQKEQQKVAAAAVERRSQSIYRQFTKLRWVVVTVVPCFLLSFLHQNWWWWWWLREATVAAIDRRYCPASKESKAKRAETNTSFCGWTWDAETSFKLLLTIVD